jgi:hypothetical protein
MMLKDIAVGDKVKYQCYSGFGDSGVEVIEKISIQYDENIGEAYNVVWLSGGRKFDARDGSAINPPMAYYITEVL